ncbi:MAG TPA: pentapeptide repeat-containing protein [Candidatus Brachybacterium merdigallinarum]|nr:pentapeptide repeat-containing protein [Candidatus Brachybacterium merdigallinarum]
MTPPRSRSSRHRRPVLSPLHLPDLASARLGQLADGGDHEGLLVEGADLSDLDLTGLVLTECELRGVTAHRTILRSARLLETRIERLNAPVLPATRSTWRGIELSGSRIGAWDFGDGELRQAHLRGSKIDWLNLRQATLEDVRFEGCTLEELDLSGATATRVEFADCRIGHLALAGARLQDVDLRGLEIGTIGNLEGLAGATLSSDQVTALAPALAAHLGLRIED